MHRARQDWSGSTVELPITLMLDMTFQLLFFFIITFNPGQREGQNARAQGILVHKNRVSLAQFDAFGQHHFTNMR